jgi:hypothetical protein
MIAPVQQRRGGPLVALGMILGCWVAVRIAFTLAGGPPALADMPSAPVSPVAVYDSGQTGADPAEPTSAAPVASAHADTVSRPDFATPPFNSFEPMERAAPSRTITVPRGPAALPVATAAGHQLLWMAALSRMPLPNGFASAAAAAPRAVPAPFYPAGASLAGPRRWSAEGWLLLRRGAGGALAAGATPPTYGGSQAGAVLRYRLAPNSRHRPEAYLRLSSAFNTPADRETAVGLSARPVAALPLRAMAELRLSDQVGVTRLRPAALVVTELQPIDLPHAARAEFYGQAGYVGGRNATAFADGQARIDKPVMQIGKAELRAGAGAWAGAQKGAARLDAGPSAVLGMPVGASGSARLGLDWRLRVAGDAQPGSGLALTLSAGF